MVWRTPAPTAETVTAPARAVPRDGGGPSAQLSRRRRGADPAQVRVFPTPQGTSGSADDVAERALERWLGTATNGQWQSVSDSDGARVESYRPGSGLFEVDKASGRIAEAIFENEITDGTATLTEELAVRNAREFADRRGENLADLEFRNAEFVDHGTFSEYRVTWQARQGGAWLPSRVTVGVNAASGRVIYYSSDPLKPRLAPNLRSPHKRLTEPRCGFSTVLVGGSRPSRVWRWSSMKPARIAWSGSTSWPGTNLAGSMSWKPS